MRVCVCMVWNSNWNLKQEGNKCTAMEKGIFEIKIKVGVVYSTLSCLVLSQTYLDL